MLSCASDAGTAHSSERPSRRRGRSRDRSFTTLSSSRIVPAVISSSPATIRSAVVFPQPDGPTRTTNSPSSTMQCQVANRLDAVVVDLADLLERKSRHDGSVGARQPHTHRCLRRGWPTRSTGSRAAGVDVDAGGSGPPHGDRGTRRCRQPSSSRQPPGGRHAGEPVQRVDRPSILDRLAGLDAARPRGRCPSAGRPPRRSRRVGHARSRDSCAPRRCAGSAPSVEARRRAPRTTLSPARQRRAGLSVTARGTASPSSIAPRAQAGIRSASVHSVSGVSITSTSIFPSHG